MQDHMEDRFARWQRTAPLAFQCGGARLPLRLMNGWSLGRGSRKNSQADEENGKGQSSVSRLHPKPPHATFRRVDDFRPKRVGMVSSADQALGVKILRPGIQKAARRSVPSKAVQIRWPSSRLGYFPFFAYQSALIGVKLFHFSGRSSSAKMAVTGQTGTHAPQSMHSVGWMYSCVSLSKSGSSLRGCMQSTGQTSTQAVSFVPMHGSAIT